MHSPQSSLLVRYKIALKSPFEPAHTICDESPGELARIDATNRQYTRFWLFGAYGNVQNRQGNKLSFSRSIGDNDYVPFIRAEVQFMRAAKNLASLHICIGSPEPSSLDNVITLPKSRASNLRAIYANSEGSLESAYLRRLASAFGTRQYDKYHNPMCWFKWRFADN